MVLRDQIQADLMRAMKLREIVVVRTLRTLLSALDNAEAVAVHQLAGQMPVEPILGQTYDVPRKVLSAEDIQQILKNEAEGRLSAIAQYEHLGKDEMVQQLRTEVALITPYMDGPISS